MAAPPLPKRTTTLVAGGGRSSGIADHQSVREFSPVLAYQLQNLYKNLAARTYGDIDGPPLDSYDHFSAWFHSPASSALAPPVNHDLSLPLCNYYISSSHNTYLSGNQLYGTASTEAYTNVLLRGCRCLEIDVWNGYDETSSASGSEHEEAEHSDKKKTKPDGSHRERALSTFKSLRGKLTHEVHAVKVRSHSPAPNGRHNSFQQRDEDDVDALTDQLHAAEIAQRSAMLKTEPRVYHGHTLTKDVPFREVCEAIRESAFKASTLPVIVSLEVHCNLDQQKVMVDIMEETWHGYLVDVAHQSYDNIQQLPSPDALRNKILVKVKWASSTNTGETNNPLELSRTTTTESVTKVQTHESEHHRSQKKKAVKVLDALSRLGVYTRAYSFKQFSQPEAKIPTHVFSLEENKLAHLHADPHHGPEMFHHNRNFLVRIYPSGLRVDSSNIDPAFSWRQGAQMVALNWQKLDKGMMLNDGMFAGEEGYVLKPEGFRSSHISGAVQPLRKRMNLSIRLAVAQNLPLPPDKPPSHAFHIKPYVKFILHVDTHGPPGQGKKDRSDSVANLKSRYDRHLSHTPNDDDDEDKDEDERKLKRRSKNGKTSTTTFEGPDMSWADIPDVVEQLSFLRIKVSDDKPLARDDLLAWACIRLDRLKTGWRLLHLLDVEGRPSEGVLLVHIEKTFR